MKARPSLVFLSPENPFNKKTASGVPYYMIKALQEYWGDVDAFYWVKNRLQHKALRLITRVSKIFANKDFDYMKSIFFSKLLGKHFTNKLSLKEYDVVFCNGPFPISYLETDVPIIIFADSSFGLLLNYYPNRSNYFKTLLQSGRTIEQKGYDKARLIVFTSSWAADYARAHYSCGNKIEVLPRGANLESNPEPSVIDYRLQNRQVCNLVFLGVDWKRKGGDIVLETFQILKQRGMKIHLTICGCQPIPPGDAITVIPFIDKSTDQGWNQFEDILTKSHFMFVPSRAEALGIALLEASAFGLPVVSTDTGGVSDAVKNDVNGYLLPLSAKAGDYAEIIQDCFVHDAHYRELCKRSYKWFDQKLTWKATITAMRELFDKKVVYHEVPLF